MRIPVMAVILGFAVTGCASDPLPRRAAGEPAPATAPGVVVTRDDASLPAGCRPRALGGRIVEFLDAVTRGDAATAARHADPARGWYSVSEGGRRHFVTTERSALASYFARRHRQGERLRLLQLDVSFANGLGHVAYLLDRRADDLRRLGVRTTIAVGKGAVDCDTGEIVVWSMGMPVGAGGAHERFGICPRPRQAAAAPVVCARRR